MCAAAQWVSGCPHSARLIPVHSGQLPATMCPAAWYRYKSRPRRLDVGVGVLMHPTKGAQIKQIAIGF